MAGMGAFLFLILDADPAVGWMGHLSGYAAGMLLVIPLRRPGVRLWTPRATETPNEALKPAALVDSG